jgi:hypothetical protein
VKELFFNGFLIAVTFLIAAGCGGASAKKDIQADSSEIAEADAEIPETAGEDTASGEPEICQDALQEDLAEFSEIMDSIDIPNELKEPLANVFLINPIENEWKTTQVSLPMPSEADFSLKNEYVNAVNCLNEEGGVSTTYNFAGLDIPVALCHEVHTVYPGEDGTYLHVIPPEEESNPDDSFAEVMAYYHGNKIHGFFKDTFEYSGMDFPAYIMANVQVNIAGVWFAIDNAAYVPGEDFQELTGVPRDFDTILLGQGTVTDFSYDSTVLYHEYTHYLIGKEKLFGKVADKYGLDYSPLSINEAHADFFAVAISGNPKIGTYALGNINGEDLARDISIPMKCPDDIYGEPHADGRILSSALWEIRKELGAEFTQKIVFDAMTGYTLKTVFTESAAAVFAEAAKKDAETGNKVKTILDAHGLSDCVRVRQYSKYDPEKQAEPFYVEGKVTTDVPEFKKFAPSYFQFEIEVPADTKKLEISFDVNNMMGLLLGEDKPGKINLLLKKGSHITYSYLSGKAEDDSDAMIETEGSGSTGNYHYTAVVSGNCLTEGKHYLQFLNFDQVMQNIYRVIIKPSVDAAAGEPNYSGCE